MPSRPFAQAVAAAVLLSVLGACSSSLTPEFHTRGLVVPTAQCAVDPRSVGDAVPLERFTKRNGCGVPNPWQVRSVGGVRLSQAATLNCGVVGALNDWVGEVAQPAAASAFGERIVGVDVAASYSCRAMNSKRGARLSEHGLGNAIDISGFTLESGRKVTVKAGWRGARDEQGFLKDVHRGSCETFSTVLGPNADRAHHDHFHLDLANRKSGRSYCR